MKNESVLNGSSGPLALATRVVAEPAAVRRLAARDARRRRVLAGMLAATAEQGYASVTVADVVAAAKVSRSAFYEEFASLEACYLAAYDACLAELTDRIRAVPAASPDEDLLRPTIQAYLAALAASPEGARACMVEVYAVGAEGIRRRLAHQQVFADALHALHRSLARRGEPVQPLTRFDVEALVTAVAGTVTNEVAMGRAADLGALAGPLVDFLRRGFGLPPVDAPAAPAEASPAARRPGPRGRS